ncbi:phage portal protein [Sporolactobacillus laevolacticus]|uniref:phage portal protein n=1 Tax=Sporolactobacillus laevolacticus TaxID=33018 RepID=UPI0025B601BB|nr:phage portal protein [Sporolactobacillus laevolacticus]MDN3956194.1 phage portal protein [Sporolactobacillus laevolacticus]
MAIDLDLIRKCYQQFLQDRIRYIVNHRYYDGHHDILNNYAMNESRSNIKVIVNYFKKFINDEVAYAIGNPINYSSSTGQDEAIQAIDLNFSSWVKPHDQELLKVADIYGKSFECEYIDQDGNFKCAVFSPLNCYALESGDAERRVILALHVYRDNIFAKEDKIDVYTENEILHFDQGFNLLGTDSHPFPGVPVIVCRANLEGRSMLHDIKSANDAFNNVLSDLVNEVSDFRTALLKVVGASVDEDELAKMKTSGVIKVPTGADVGYLIKNINDTFVQNTLNTLEEKIYKMASHIDTNEKLQSNTSGVALRSRLISLENKCVLMESMLEIAIKQRLKYFFYIQNLKSNTPIDYRTIKLKFTPNIPSDLTATSDAISKLTGIVSQETLLSLLSFVENPKIEMKKFKAEQQANRLIPDNAAQGDLYGTQG